MIPLEGARVRSKVGPHAGQTGITGSVTDGRAKLDGLDPQAVMPFVKRQRAQFGKDWITNWYEAEVSFPDGVTELRAWNELEVVETDLARPARFRPLR